jgi:predicted CXXCH cytochrome family protein
VIAAALRRAVAGVCAAGLLTACGGSREVARASRPVGRGPDEPLSVRSNVARADYAGSAACATCHPGVTSTWALSPMHRMTRDARGAAVQAPFNGTEWRFKDDLVRLELRGADRFVSIAPAGAASSTYRVTRIIGGRTREDFAGVDAQTGGEEVVLPVSFLIGPRTLRYKGYSVMVHERASLRAGPIWSRTCIFCHNTVPEMDRLLGALAGPRAPAYQGEQVDPWLSPDRRLQFRVADPEAFAVVASEEIARLGGVAPRGDEVVKVTRRAIDVVRSGFDGEDLVEQGIGCEACHGGSREHAADPRVRTSMAPTAPWLDVAPVPSGPQAINHACARCHQVLFSRYPFTWEGGRRDSSPGGSHINSGEARDFLLGGCSKQMACTACHDPHSREAPARLAALATPEGNTTCTACHAKFADRSGLAVHARHDPGGAGGSCVACHMPRKNMGLDGTLTRYHRIGSPTDPERVLGDRPLECALCHAERSVGWVIDAMERLWPVRYPRQRILELYGSLDANVMTATLERGKPHEQAVAIATLGERRARDAVPLIARQLTGEYPLVREWAKRALTAILGRCDVDLAQDDVAIARAASACGGAVGAAPGASAGGADEDPED